MVDGILFNGIIFVAGLAILLKGADFFTDSCANFARYFGISDIMVGMVFVAFATTLPELTVSVTASFAKAEGIALGTVLGSNIANIGFVVAVLILLGNFKINGEARKDSAIMLLALIVASALIIGGITQVEGAILFSMIVFYIIHTAVFSRPKGKEIIPKFEINLPKLFVLLGLSAVGVMLGSRLVVNSAVYIAKYIGVSEIVIGITVIAIGTSLPELTNALFAAKKGHPGLAIGNLIGANLFNISAVLGVSAIINSIEITKRVVFVDIPFMLLFAVCLVALMREKRAIGKTYGIIFLAIYAVFLLLQFVKL